MRTLLVEDEFTSRCLLSELVAPFGRCDVAVDGEEAIRAVKGAIAAGTPYELVLLDIRLPRLDGQKALREIRKMEEEANLWPGQGAAAIIMTTSLSAAGTVVDSFRDQCDGYLVKPVQSQAFLRTLEKLGLASSKR